MAAADAIGLWLLFDPNVVYACYAGADALADQHGAGAIMFAAGMVPLLVGAGIAYRWMSPATPARSQPARGCAISPTVGSADRRGGRC
jgi:Cytochrome c oxidase caa3 assembly factor (Caa3_CtaG)